VPFTVEVDPEPSMICTLTPENCTVALPSTPAATYDGARTGTPDEHDGVPPAPPEVTAWPAVVGTHSQAGAADAHAGEAIAPAAKAASTAAPAARSRV